jgi:hypothetical protein
MSTDQRDSRDSLATWPNVADVAGRLGVTQMAVRKRIWAGRLAVVVTRVGILVDPQSADAYARERAARPVHWGNR